MRSWEYCRIIMNASPKKKSLPDIHYERQQHRQSKSRSNLVEETQCSENLLALPQNWKANRHMWEFHADAHIFTHPPTHPLAHASHCQECEAHCLAEAAGHSHQCWIKETWKTVYLQIKIWSQMYFEFLCFKLWVYIVEFKAFQIIIIKCTYFE